MKLTFLESISDILLSEHSTVVIRETSAVKEEQNVKSVYNMTNHSCSKYLCELLVLTKFPGQ